MSAPARGTGPLPAPDRKLDIRGEVCPMTLVRTVLELEQMAVGEVLEVLVDHAPASENLPRTLRREGQAVLLVEAAGDGLWRLVVRKEPGGRR